MATPNPGDRAKAYRLRKAVARGDKLRPIDALWLQDYDHHQRTSTGGARTRSRKGRKIDLHVEEAEDHEASADSPAAIAAAAALQTRAEGERLDSLTVNALQVLKEAVFTYRKLCDSVTNMLAVYQQAHLETLGAVRTHYLARAEAESAAIEAAREAADAGDPAKELMVMALMKQLNIELPGGTDPAAFFRQQAAAARARAGKNGAKPGTTGG